MRQPLPMLWWFKCSCIVVALLFGVSYCLPSLLPKLSQWPVFPSSRINLGLDLKGGLSLTLNVNVDTAVKEAMTRALARARDDLATRQIAMSYNLDDAFVAHISLDNGKDTPEVQKAVLAQTNLLLAGNSDGHEVLFTPNAAAIKDYQKQIMEQAINTIRNRVDQFGVAEPNIFQSGNERVVVELPGLTDSEHAKALLGNTARLDFRMVLHDVPQTELAGLLQEARKALGIAADDQSTQTIEALAQWLRQQKKIPTHATVLLFKPWGGQAADKSTGSEEESQARTQTAFLVDSHATLTGDDLDDAQAVQSTEDFVPQYVVNLKFKPQGAKLFGDLTTKAALPENTPHAIAIVLDQTVQSAPVVSGPILGGNARITMGRSTNLESQLTQAQDLALVLRTGALPTSVNVVEERQIGPSEGAQNIRAGLISTCVAAGVVAALMLLIYGVSGFVANIAMFLNVIFILACMAIFGATLTLPGIAGIVLTMAIAVDGNVIINERIREELRAGKSQRDAFYKGYQTSFRTLIDAHVTSAVAGIVLLIYGNAAIKGFAVTLLCGIVCTLFTSYYVTQVIGQWLIEKTKLNRFS